MNNPYTAESRATLDMEATMLGGTIDKSQATVQLHLQLVQAFLEVSRDYTDRASKLSRQMSQHLNSLSRLEEGSRGFGESTQKIKATLDAFDSYRKDVKPALKAELGEVKMLLSDLHSDQVRVSITVRARSHIHSRTRLGPIKVLVTDD